jgi:hypothetical protein
VERFRNGWDYSARNPGSVPERVDQPVKRDYVVVGGDTYHLPSGLLLSAFEAVDDLTALSVARIEFCTRQVTVFDVTGTGISSEARRVQTLEPSVTTTRRPQSGPYRSSTSLSKSMRSRNNRRYRKRMRKGLHLSDGNHGV